MPAISNAGNTDTIIAKYNESYEKLQELLRANGSFRKAVYITEKTFQQILTERVFLDYIYTLTILAERNRARSYASGYYSSDSANYLLNRSIFSTICDTARIKKGSAKITLLPYTYNFKDPNGKLDWTNMFVTKLLATHKGNCHSLAYLYKILADELGASCWLALAPGHIYIRNYSDKIGWYNTELTSGAFPTDAWIATTGYVSTDAIRSGIYMDTLSNQQSIALCILDLAKGYERQTHNYYDGFILKCCDLALQYHPVNPIALLLKAETLQKVHLKQTDENDPRAAATYTEMEDAYITLAKLHYREMPEKMYLEWLNSLTKQSDKYTNKQVKQPVKSRKTK